MNKYTRVHQQDVEKVLTRAVKMGVRVDPAQVDKLLRYTKQVVSTSGGAWRDTESLSPSSLESQIQQLTSHANVILSREKSPEKTLSGGAGLDGCDVTVLSEHHENFAGLLLDRCDLLAEWPQKDQVGEGGYGLVSISCYKGSPDDCDYVVKVQQDDMFFRNEVNILQYLQGETFVPKMYAAWTCRGKGYIVLEKLTPATPEFIYEHMGACLDALDDLRSKHVYHRDLHDENIMRRGDEPVIIDFGYSIIARRGDRPYTLPTAFDHIGGRNNVFRVSPKMLFYADSIRLQRAVGYSDAHFLQTKKKVEERLLREMVDDIASLQQIVKRNDIKELGLGDDVVALEYFNKQR